MPRRNKKNKGSAMKIAKRALRATRKLQGELKYHDINVIGSAGHSLSAQIIGLSNIGQGDGINERTGNKILWKSFSIRWCAFINDNLTVQLVRVMVVLDKQPNGNQFTLVSLLNDQTEPTSYLSRSTQGRYSVLYNKITTLTNTGSNKEIYHAFHKSINVASTYLGTGGVVPNKNSLSIVLMAENNVDLTDFNGKCRLRYVDN